MYFHVENSLNPQVSIHTTKFFVERFQFGSHWSPTVTDWHLHHLLHVARTTTAIFCQKIRCLNSTKSQMAHRQAEVNGSTLWTASLDGRGRSVTYSGRLARGSHVRPICSTWQTQDSASALALGISHSRKRFETKCLAVYNSCVTFDCSCIWSSGRRRTKINSSHYRLLLISF
jgi:hypothetical protein